MLPIRIHKRLTIPSRMFCLALLTLLLANAALGMGYGSTGCDGVCCCCASSGHSPTLAMGNSRSTDAECCGTPGATPCRMTAGRLPTKPPALLQNTNPTTCAFLDLLLGQCGSTAASQSDPLSLTQVATAPSTPPLYLQTCRLIC